MLKPVLAIALVVAMLIVACNAPPSFDPVNKAVRGAIWTIEQSPSGKCYEVLWSPGKWSGSIGSEVPC